MSASGKPKPFAGDRNLPTSSRIWSRLSPVFCVLVLTIVAASTLHAQAESDPSTSGALYDDLARMDSVLFHAAFVACDLPTLNSLLTDDVEFYHDKNGFESGQEVRQSFERLTQACPRDRGVTRELVDGSLQVYPIKDYGAVQMGVHRFVERGASTSTEARFIHLWRNTGGGWRLTRVLSFDHRPAAPPSQ